MPQVKHHFNVYIDATECGRVEAGKVLRRICDSLEYSSEVIFVETFEDLDPADSNDIAGYMSYSDADPGL